MLQLNYCLKGDVWLPLDLLFHILLRNHFKFQLKLRLVLQNSGFCSSWLAPRNDINRLKQCIWIVYWLFCLAVFNMSSNRITEYHITKFSVEKYVFFNKICCLMNIIPMLSFFHLLTWFTLIFISCALIFFFVSFTAIQFSYHSCDFLVY